MQRRAGAALAAVLIVVFAAVPAAADHTDPNTRQAAGEESPVSGAHTPDHDIGEWEVIANFAPNPGTDLDFFEIDGVVYAAGGTLGQASEQHVGQRILRLIDAEGNVDPQWVADHGSANCGTANPSGTLGLQHDVQVTPNPRAPGFEHTGEPELLIDTTDATGRCHDAPGGGLEIVDISGLGEEDFEVREIALTRHDGTSHTTTVDATRPHIVYTSPAGFGGAPYIEFADISTCLGLADQSLEAKREACRPQAYRIPFDPAWSVSQGLEPVPANAANCHDITATPGRIYCAGLAATLIFDVSGLTNAAGEVQGTPIPCEVVEGTTTAAMVSDCQFGTYDEYVEAGSPQAEGWEFLGSVNHVGRDCGAGPTPVTCNSNFVVPSDQEVAVSHEADPTHDGNYMFVTDERGGGVVPGGATCTPGIDNPYGNGGVHAYDIRDPANITHALGPDGEPAVYITDSIVPAPTFCTAHVMELLPGENRWTMAWYSQGIKFVDYAIDENGAWTFSEVGSFTMERAETWTAEVFHIVDNDDGSRTYYLMTNDIGRGMDIVSWTAQPNPTPVVVERIAGDGPTGTAVAVSQDSGHSGGAVVVGRDDVYADSLAGGPLAASLDAPLLLSDSDTLTPATRDEIERLGAERAVLLGGIAALSDAVAADLEGMGLEVERVGGANRFETAQLIAAEVGSATGEVFIAEGEHTDPQRGWPDPIAAAAYAGFRGDPILLVNRERLPAETVAAVTALGADEAVVIGGDAAVSEAVVGELETATGVATRRLEGQTRYETSEAVFTESVAEGMDPTRVWFATGTDWRDALVAGPAAAIAGEPLALLDGQGGADTSEAILSAVRDRLRIVRLVGDTDSITAAVEARIRAFVAPPPAEDGQDAEAAAAISGIQRPRSAPPPATGPNATDAALVAAAAAVVLLAWFRRRRVILAPA